MNIDIRAKTSKWEHIDIKRWLAFLEKYIPEATLKELMSMEPAIEKAENKLEYLSSDENTMSIYWERERSLHERANMINTAVLKEKKDIAKNLKTMNVPVENIVKITGLTIDEIKELKF